MSVNDNSIRRIRCATNQKPHMYISDSDFGLPPKKKLLIVYIVDESHHLNALCSACIHTFLFSSTEGLWSRLSPDRAHRGEQVQHLRFSGVAQQEEAHVCGTERQRKANEGEEDTEEKHSHSLPAHCGTTTMIGHVSHGRKRCKDCRVSDFFFFF